MRVLILASEANGTTFSSRFGIGRGSNYRGQDHVGKVLDVELDTADLLLWGVDIFPSEVEETLIWIADDCTWINARVDYRGYSRDWDPMIMLEIDDFILQIYLDYEKEFDDGSAMWMTLKVSDPSIYPKT